MGDLAHNLFLCKRVLNLSIRSTGAPLTPRGETTQAGTPTHGMRSMSGGGGGGWCGSVPGLTETAAAPSSIPPDGFDCCADGDAMGSVLCNWRKNPQCLPVGHALPAG